MILNLTQTHPHMLHFKIQNKSYYLQLKAKGTYVIRSEKLPEG